MLYQNLKLALRNILKYKAVSLINILGLTLGFTCCIIIGLYSIQEFSFDKFNRNHNRIFRINKITDEKNKPQVDAITPGLLSLAIKKDIPEVVQSARFRPWYSDMPVSFDSIHLTLRNVAYTDPSLLTIFDFPLLAGDKTTALQQSSTAIITESVAKKYFNHSNPIGKTLLTLNNIPVKITGVLKDLPSNSSLQFTMLISFATLTSPTQASSFSWMNNWSAQVHYTFVQLLPGADEVIAGRKISGLMHKNFSETEFQYRTYLQALDEIHLHSNDILYAGPFKTANGKIVYTLLLVAGIILVIACFNFINLTTAGSMARAKEIGIQKVMGSGKLTLILKFFSESFINCLIAFISAVFISKILLIPFTRLADVVLDLDLLFNLKFIGMLLALLLLVSVLAGLYPAIYMAEFKSTDVFRNTVQAGKSGWVRKTLVTTQFAMSILLIIATIVVNRQTSYISKKDLGFDKEQMIVLPLSNTLIQSKRKAFMDILRQDPGIVSISASISVPGQGFNGFGIIPEGHRAGEHLMANVLETDADFISTYKMKLLQGRFFKPELPSDTARSIVINEAMAHYLNENNPVGTKLEIYELRKGNVIGVVKDFNFASLHETVQPLAIVLSENAQFLSVRLKNGNVQSTIQNIKNVWQSFEKEYPFEYYFLDERLNHYYLSDIRLLNVLNIFTGLAITIASFGLFGLSLYTARQRTKEIGIRKVLGSSAGRIVILLSKDLLILVAVASLIAFPVAWWTMNNWLSDFAYHIKIGPWAFITAGISTLLVSLGVISFQSVKAANANPVKSLRTE